MLRTYRWRPKYGRLLGYMRKSFPGRRKLVAGCQRLRFLSSCRGGTVIFLAGRVFCHFAEVREIFALASATRDFSSLAFRSMGNGHPERVDNVVYSAHYSGTSLPVL